MPLSRMYLYDDGTRARKSLIYFRFSIFCHIVLKLGYVVVTLKSI